MTSNSQSPTSDTESHGIRIEAAAQYLPQESDPDSGKYFYVYRIRILNEGEHHARLLTRHWVILDSNNQRGSLARTRAEQQAEGWGDRHRRPGILPDRYDL
jgi:hypothetical protein